MLGGRRNLRHVIHINSQPLDFIFSLRNIRYFRFFLPSFTQPLNSFGNHPFATIEDAAVRHTPPLTLAQELTSSFASKPIWLARLVNFDRFFRFKSIPTGSNAPSTTCSIRIEPTSN